MNNAFYEFKHINKNDYFIFMKIQDFKAQSHLHWCYEMILALEGTVGVQLENQLYTLLPGDLLLVRPNLVHSYDYKDDKPNVVFMCIFAPDLIAAINEPLIHYHLPSPLIKNLPQLYRDMFSAMSLSASIGRIKGFLYSTSCLFYEQLDFSRKYSLTGKGMLLRDIMYYIEENIHNPCPIQDLAKTLGYSPSYLSRYFHAKLGISYSEYVRSTKINHACYLLRNTTKSIEDIMCECGYVSSSSFNLNFKSQTGMSPTAYRRKKD